MSDKERSQETIEEIRARLVREARDEDALEEKADELRKRKTKKNPPLIPTDPTQIKQ
ncbi:hypothetical protein KBD68_04620 [Candidatus Woesebacteria bacterium]|nr:hypothetical protein [Candidatus Woesebacteria bacterium]